MSIKHAVAIAMAVGGCAATMAEASPAVASPAAVGVKVLRSGTSSPVANAAVAIYYNPSDPPKSGSVSLTKIGSGTTNADGELSLRLNLARSPGARSLPPGHVRDEPGAARSTITGTLRSSFPAGPWRGDASASIGEETSHTVANADTVHQSYHKFQFAQYSVEEVATTICVGQPPSVNTYHWALRTWTGGLTGPVLGRTAPTRITRRPLAALLLATKSCPEKSPSETPGKLTRLPPGLSLFGIGVDSKAEYSSATSELWRWEAGGCPSKRWLWGSGGGGYATAPIVEMSCPSR